MSDVYIFKIHEAHAELTDGGLVVKVVYPDNPEIVHKKLDANPEFGIQVFENLLTKGFSPIADSNNPIKPASAGSLYVLSDGKIVCHRRNKSAPGKHRLYHSAYAGFPNSREELYSAAGLEAIALRESAEECLLVTKDKEPWLVVPKDSKDYTLSSAKRLGLNLKSMFVDVETMNPTDLLEVYDERKDLIFKANTFVEFTYETSTSLNCLSIRHFPLSSEEVLPIDAEGMVENGKFIHFNRESYVLSPREIENKFSGAVMKNPSVYQTKIVNGKPTIYTPQYQEPFWGPGGVEVTHPHIWAPEDMLTRILDAFGIDGYKGRWMEIEQWKETKRLRKESQLPDEIIKR